MAFRTQSSLARQYDQIKLNASHVKTQCASRRTQMAAGPVAVYDISTGLLGILVEAAERFSSVPAGLDVYAQAQENDPAYDVAAEFVAMRAAIIAARDWLIANLPKDANGRLLERSIVADGTVSLVTVTSAQTAPLRTLLSAIESTIG